MGNILRGRRKKGKGINEEEEEEEEDDEDDNVRVALYDFEARSNGELSFVTGDRLIIFDTENEDWLHAVSNRTQLRGLVPNNFLIQAGSLESYEWFFGEMTRVEANHQLKNLPSCSFLIRVSIKDESKKFVVSVKNKEKISEPLSEREKVKHFAVEEHDGSFVIFDKSFPSIPNLVKTWKASNTMHKIQLGEPCPRDKQVLYDISSKTKDDWELIRSHIKKKQLIGSGNFGKVYLGTYNDGEATETIVAIKTLKLGSMTVEDFLQEAAVMKTLRHKNIIKLFGVCSREQPYYIVTEYMSNGSLVSLLRKSVGKLEESNLCDLALQIACGMVYLEEQNLAHRDLAARNVLVDQGLTCKVADFGLAKFLEDEIYSDTFGKKFPFKWSAPEVIDFRQFSCKSDVWSFAITFIEIFTFGAMPYAGYTNPEATDAVVQGYRIPKPKNCSDAIFEIIDNCWKAEAKDRWTFKVVYEKLSELSSSKYGYY